MEVSSAATVNAANHLVSGATLHPIIDATVLATTSTTVWMGIGAASIVSVGVNYFDYKAKKAGLLELYQDEIATKLGKSTTQVTNQDMETLAAGIPEKGIPANTVLAEELEKLKADRNLGFLTTVLSVCATMLVLTGLIALTGPTGLFAAHLTGGAFASWANFGVAALRGGIAFGCHKILEEPIRWGGEKMLGMDIVSTHERIEELVNEREAGKALSKEQVLGVFISVNPELEGFVRKNFGKTYDKLDLQVKQAIANSFEQFIPLSDVVDSLNSGRVKITELAFSAIGQQSGVKPSDNPVAPKVNVIGKARGVFYDVASRFKLRQPLQKLPELQQIQSANGQPQIQAYSPPVRPQYKPMYYEQNERADNKKWAQMVKPQSVTPTNEPAVSGGRG